MDLLKSSSVQTTVIDSPDPSAIVPAWVGSSPAMKQMLRDISRIAPIHKPVLITGESGTGKESAARFIHTLSELKTWVEVCCTDLTPTLIESQLCGHKRGAFTGAVHDHAGFFEQANGGTLFLDEIGDLPLDLQPHLLRLLQEGRVRRLGDTHMRSVSVRVVCATNRDLAAMVRQGTFRKDLYHRLAFFKLKTPPLREREHDILLLAQRYLELEGLPRCLSQRAQQALLTYSWPGNIRELQYVVYNAALNCEDLIDIKTLMPFMEGAIDHRSLGVQYGVCYETLSDIQRNALSEIQRCGHVSVIEMAQFLKISQSTARRFLNALIDAGFITRHGQARATMYSIRLHTE